MIAKHTSDAISSSAASTVSSSFVASRPATRKPPELTSRCYASQQQGSGSKLSTRPNPEWRDKVGEGTSVDWPTGVGGKGNEGVAVFVGQIKNSIGYVEY